ncbi:MAG TPA: threonine synthase [Dehalococcoidia bacterium]|nr:threonine synthase [Dehalococcoidia bacterium]
MKSYLSHLECTNCGKTLSADELHTTCPDCGKVLYARYDLESARRGFDRAALASRPGGMWRWFELMPVRNEVNVVTLGEGGTPLLRAAGIEAATGAREVWVKEEGLNPTGSFKARGLSAAVSKAKELGVKRVAVPSAGNAASALAAYGAKAGMETWIFMPQDTPDAMKHEAQVYGAHVTLVDGLINDAGRIVRENTQAMGWFDVSTLREPYRAEGKKTMGLELAEQLGWKLPEALIYPTGGGTGIVGMWKAFEELEALGWIGPERPKMISVQAEGCAPIVRAFEAGERFAETWVDAHTIAPGIRVPAAIADYLILDAIRESGGTAITVTDAEILESMHEMARLEGIFAAPEGAATYAAYKQLLASGFLAPDEGVVLFNTGAGLKTHELVTGEYPVMRAGEPLRA